ncbi:MAG: ETC complex I subunit [Alphaproteobacteria bacterium]|nr:ETC complex I subunit [Alphaproteobacteria bacterium]HRW28982.1 ETC complex I subunit [Emcibacteraceae bacterium]
MIARIFKPTKNAMQSGMKRSKKWHFEYAPEKARSLDPLMGWTGSSDMKSQIRLTFDTKQEAVAYAERNGIDYVVQEPHTRKKRLKSYADVFAFRPQ